MKSNLHLILFLIVVTTVSAQVGILSYQSFSLENKEIVWAQVYHLDGSINNISKNLFQHLEKKSWIQNLRFDGTDIVGELTEYKPDYKRYGGKYMNTSSVTRTGRWRGKVLINFKDGKYRVLLYGLNYEASQSSTGSGKATIEQHTVNGTIEEWALNNFRNSFRKNRMKDLDILHFSFKDSFTLTYNQEIDRDW